MPTKSTSLSAASIWNRDLIADAIIPLNHANKLWYATTRSTRTGVAEIDALLVRAQAEITAIRAELGTASDTK